jgi:hypothetical protein
MLDGVDVSRFHVGDILDLPDADATMLIAERWAEPAADTSFRANQSQPTSPTIT